MTSFYLKLGLLFSLLLAAVILLIHLQPYDDTELRAFLTPPDGCPAPCFMGIRPGVTTVDEAEQILKKSGIAGKISLEGNRYKGSGFVNWDWNDKQNTLIDTSKRGELYISNGITSYVSFWTHITPIQVRWLYGKPTWYDFAFREGYTTTRKYAFSEHGIIISNEIPGCLSPLNSLTREGQLQIQVVEKTHLSVYEDEPIQFSLQDFKSFIPHCQIN
jgi:hypothetical protein